MNIRILNLKINSNRKDYVDIYNFCTLIIRQIEKC